MNEESILDYVKKLLGIQKDYTHFDPDVIYGINAAFGVLNQLGVGPAEGFMISDDTAKWNEFVPDTIRLSIIKPYVYLKTRLLFDPPSSSALIESINKTIAEYEWRLYVQSDPKNTTSSSNSNGSYIIDWGDSQEDTEIKTDWG